MSIVGKNMSALFFSTIAVLVGKIITPRGFRLGNHHLPPLVDVDAFLGGFSAEGASVKVEICGGDRDEVRLMVDVGSALRENLVKLLDVGILNRARSLIDE